MPGYILLYVRNILGNQFPILRSIIHHLCRRGILVDPPISLIPRRASTTWQLLAQVCKMATCGLRYVMKSSILSARIPRIASARPCTSDFQAWLVSFRLCPLVVLRNSLIHLWDRHPLQHKNPLQRMLQTMARKVKPTPLLEMVARLGQDRCDAGSAGLRSRRRRSETH